MGNSRSQVIGSPNLNDFDNLNRFIVEDEKRLSDIFNYEVLMYTQLSNKNKIACIQKAQKTEHFTEHQVKHLQDRIDFPHECLLNLRGFCSYSNGDSMCGSSYSQCFLVDNPIATLKDELEIRYIENETYSELDLWGFMRSIVSGLKELHRMGQTCRNISSSTIYINKTGQFQIAELCLVKDSSILDEIILQIYSKDMYLCPQQFEILKDGGTLHDTSNAFASDIFALGVLLIEMIYLSDQSVFFNYMGDIKLDLAGLQEMLNHRDKTHSKVLLRLIGQMIQEQEEDRIQLDALFDEANRNYNRVRLSQVELEVKMDKSQRKTSVLYRLENRNNLDKDYMKRKSVAGMTFQEALQKRRGETGLNRKYTCRFVYQETKERIEEGSSESNDEPSNNLYNNDNNIHGDVLVNSAPFPQHTPAGSSAGGLNESQLSSQISSSNNKHNNFFVKGFEKLQKQHQQEGQNSKNQKQKQYTLAEIARLRTQTKELQEKHDDLADIEVKDKATVTEIDALAKRIYENQQAEIEFEKQQEEKRLLQLEIEKQKQIQEQQQREQALQEQMKVHFEEIQNQVNAGDDLDGNGFEGSQFTATRQQSKYVNVNSKLSGNLNLESTYNDQSNVFEDVYWNTPKHNSPYALPRNAGSRKAGGGNNTPMHISQYSRNGRIHQSGQVVYANTPQHSSNRNQDAARRSTFMQGGARFGGNMVISNDEFSSSNLHNGQGQLSQFNPIVNNNIEQSLNYQSRYDQRINKNNQTTNRYQAVQSVFFNEQASPSAGIISPQSKSAAVSARGEQKFKINMKQNSMHLNNNNNNNNNQHVNNDFDENKGFKNVTVAANQSISSILRSNSKKFSGISSITNPNTPKSIMAGSKTPKAAAGATTNAINLGNTIGYSSYRNMNQRLNDLNASAANDPQSQQQQPLLSNRAALTKDIGQLDIY